MPLCCSRVVVDSVALGGAVCGCVGFIVAFRVLCGCLLYWCLLLLCGLV